MSLKSMSAEDGGFSLNISYHFHDGSLRTTALQFEATRDYASVSFALLMEKIDYIPRDHDVKRSWILCAKTGCWVRTPTDGHLSTMIRFTLENGQSSVDIRLQNNPNSPNNSPHGTPTSLPKINVVPVNDMEPELISTFKESDFVVIPSDSPGGGKLSICWRNLLLHIKAQLANGVNVFEITVESSWINNGEEVALFVCLSSSIWQFYLLRNHSGYEEFLELHCMLMDRIICRDKDLKTLHSNTHLWLRVKFYHHDLKHFSSDPIAAGRLSNTHQPFFMSDCYFSEDERYFLLNFPTSTGLPLRELFDEMQRAKGGITGESSILCSSHDLAPIIERAFGIRKGYEKETQFIGGWKKFRKVS
jgi:hypothetical protein